MSDRGIDGFFLTSKLIARGSGMFYEITSMEAEIPIEPVREKTNNLGSNQV